GALVVSRPYVAELIFTPIIVLVLAAFLRWTRYGIAIRAVAENREAAIMRGISPTRMSSLAWALAGALSAYAAVLQAPSQGFALVVSSEALGPGLLVRALLVGVAARMSTIPRALAAAIVLGVFEQVLLWNN